MAQAILNWSPGGGANSTGQTIQYKLSTTSTWTDFQTVAPTVSTATITGLQDNVIYDFRVVDNCSDGGPTPSPPFQGVTITCPTVTYTDAPTTITYSFAHLGGDITRYIVQLLNASNAILDTRTHNVPSGTLSGTFVGLTPSTNYQVRITVYAGATQQFSKTCPVSNRTTLPPATCNAPTNVVATMG